MSGKFEGNMANVKQWKYVILPLSISSNQSIDYISCAFFYRV
jgi:hypothetical protein